MERTECPSSTNFSTSTVRNSSCRRSIATSRGTGVAGLFMLAVYTLRLHPPRRILHTFLSPVSSPVSEHGAICAVLVRIADRQGLLTDASRRNEYILAPAFEV